MASSLKSYIKLCTFDITNTLLKFNHTVGEQYVKVARIYGVERDPARLTSSFRHHWKVMTLTHPNFGSATGLTSRMWWKELVRRTFTSGSSKLTDAELDAIFSHLYDMYATAECWQVTTGAKELLHKLQEKNVTLGVISNFDERLEPVLVATGLKSYFNFILSSYIIKITKPNPEIFKVALIQNPGINAFNSLHIGDDVKLDYLAAKKAGWNALLVADNPSNIENINSVKPEEIIQNVSEIENFVQFS